MIVRVRPIFREWQLGCRLSCWRTPLDFADLVAVAELAGRVEGLGDARKLGYGRFDAEIEQQ